MIKFEAVSTWDANFVQAIRNHYTGSRGAPVGKKMAWRIVEDGVHLGWIGIGEPSFKLAARRRIGLCDARPLQNTVNNFIFRLERKGQAKASAVLKQWHPIASQQWEARYGWPIVHWETMIDSSKTQSKVCGACYRRAGYRRIGKTTGRTCRRPAGNTHGARVWSDGTVKDVFYRGPLSRIDAAPGIDCSGD
jgi:hypothetical protein